MQVRWHTVESGKEGQGGAKRSWPSFVHAILNQIIDSEAVKMPTSLSFLCSVKTSKHQRAYDLDLPQFAIPNLLSGCGLQGSLGVNSNLHVDNEKRAAHLANLHSVALETSCNLDYFAVLISTLNYEPKPPAAMPKNLLHTG